MQWAHPETVGDIPPPCRAHSATQVDRRIFVFGGGEGPTYYNHLFVLDTVMRNWTKINYATNEPQPIARRAHATWYYHGKVYLFGGGNGAKALNDIWTLDASLPYEKMRWDPVEVKGVKPRPRGYHTANLVGDSVVIIGGSDGAECFEDVWVLNLGPSLSVFDFWHCD
jgi:Rab9 effector protein with kelch motifs